MKDLKESVYHGAVISILAIGYTMLGKTFIKMSPPSLGKFDVEDSVKLVAIVAISDFTKDYLSSKKYFLIISPCIMRVQYIGGCSVHWGVFSTSGVFSTLGGYHEYIGGYHEYVGGCSVHWGIS